MPIPLVFLAKGGYYIIDWQLGREVWAKQSIILPEGAEAIGVN